MSNYMRKTTALKVVAIINERPGWSAHADGDDRKPGLWNVVAFYGPRNKIVHIYDWSFYDTPLKRERHLWVKEAYS